MQSVTAFANTLEEVYVGIMMMAVPQELVLVRILLKPTKDISRDMTQNKYLNKLLEKEDKKIILISVP